MRESASPVDSKILEKIIQAISVLPRTVYSPKEDTFLMLDAISAAPIENKKILDMGTGSGILALYCAVRGAEVTASDVDEAAVHHALHSAKALKVKLQGVVSDMFSRVIGRFDFILFNPPYLPSQAIEDRTVDGGDSGITVIKRFLEGVRDHLNPSGVALLLLSSQNDPKSLMEEHPEYAFSVAARTSLFFEELQVLELRFREDISR